MIPSYVHSLFFWWTIPQFPSKSQQTIVFPMIFTTFDFCFPLYRPTVSRLPAILARFIYLTLASLIVPLLSSQYDSSNLKKNKNDCLANQFDCGFFLNVSRQTIPFVRTSNVWIQSSSLWYQVLSQIFVLSSHHQNFERITSKKLIYKIWLFCNWITFRNCTPRTRVWIEIGSNYKN